MLKREFCQLRSRWPPLISSFISRYGPDSGFSGKQKKSPQAQTTLRGMTALTGVKGDSWQF